MTRAALWVAALLGLLPAATVAQEQQAAPKPLSLSGYIRLTGLARSGYRSDGAATKVMSGDRDALLDPRLTLDLELRHSGGRLAAKLRLINRHLPDAVPPGADRGDFPDAPDEAAYAQPWPQQAYLDLRNTWGPLLLRGGLQPLRYALREQSGAFLLDLPEAESFEDDHSIWAAVGGRSTYKWELLNQPLWLDLFYLRTLARELRDGRESVWGLNADFMPAGPRSGLNNLLNVIVAGISHGDRHVGTVGGGIDYHLSDFWELYGELYGQFGDRGGEGAGQLGARHTWFDRRSEPYLELSFEYRSRDFISYENVDTFRILEDDILGLDVDNNYWAVKLRAGLNLEPALNEDILLELRYGYFRTAEGVGGIARQLGHEIDLTLRWRVDESVTLSAGAAALLDSEHFEDRDGKSTGLLVYLEAEWKF